MNYPFKTSALILASALLLASGSGLLAQTNQPEMKITDSKLHSINYGINSLDHWIAKAKPGDSARAAKLIQDLEKLETRFGRLPKSESEQYKHVAGRLQHSRDAIKGIATTTSSSTSAKDMPAIKDTAAAKPHRDLINISQQLSGLQQDIPRYKDNQKQRYRMRSDLGTLQQRFDRIPASQHPDYLRVQKQLASTANALMPDGDLQMTGKQVAEYVESIRVKYSQQLLLPESRDIMRSRELTAADVDGIVSKMKAFGENAEQDLPQLRKVVQATGKGDYWLRWLEKDSVEKMKRNMESIKASIDKSIESGLRNVKGRSELDPEKNRFAFATESVRAQNQADHARTLRTIKQAIRLQEALGVPTTWSQKLVEMQDYIAAYEVKARMASSVRELPAEVGSKEHHKIATEVLSIKKYGVGKIVHQIVNSKPVPRDRIEHKSRSGNIETIVRQWKEFQVTTVEKEGDKLFVYVNNIANFSRAPRTTPINQWILKQRYKRGEIKQADVAAAVKK